MKEIKKTSVHPVSEENPGFLLWQVSTLWSKATTAALKSIGLTHPQFVILATIDFLKDKGASLEEIAKRTVLETKVTSHLLRSLEVKGLINQSPSTDERLKFPQITTAGTETLAKAFPVVERSDADFFASLDLKSSNIIATLQTLACANFSKNGEETCDD
jgi:DNA-binding MarR family transcriptional regulator